MHLARAASGGRRRYGLDTTVQAMLCLGETPKPRVPSAGVQSLTSVAPTPQSSRAQGSVCQARIRAR
ncbi:MAG: hypothetical protein NZ874_01170, partial [Fimbriimonadales bacterium]|nr:hypothetical protein [Fimbriimonadales bacterium]